MCECIKTTESQLREILDTTCAHLKPKGSKELRLLMPKNAGYSAKKGMILSIPFEASWIMESGKVKETIVPFIASHCPFCGDKFDTSE